MTENQNDPPRMFEVDEVPADLRLWLSLAHDDVPTDSQIEQLVDAVEHRAGARGVDDLHAPTESPIRRIAMANPGGMLSLARRPGRIMASLAIVGLGLAGWVGATNRRVARVDRGTPSVAENRTEPAGVTQVRVGERFASNLDASSPALIAADPGIDTEPIADESRQVAQRTVPVARRSAAKGSSDSTTHNPPETGPAADSAEEYRLVRAARQAGKGDPARALAITDEHLRRFPRGMLAQERETLAIEALTRLARVAQARRRAQGFLLSYPASPYSNRIQAAVGTVGSAASQ